MKPFKKIMLLSITPLFLIGFISYLIAGSFIYFLPKMIFFTVGFLVITSLIYVYVFERLQAKKNSVFKNIILSTSSIFILVFAFGIAWQITFFDDFNILTPIYQGFLSVFILLLEIALVAIYKNRKSKNGLKFNEKPFTYLFVICAICLTETLILSIFSIELLQNEEFNFIRFCYESFLLRTFTISSASMAFLYIFSLLKFTRDNLLLSFFLTVLITNLLFFILGYIQVMSEMINYLHLTIISTILSTIIILYRNNIQETKFKIHNLTSSISKKNAEYLQLKNQVNPHFLFNNLNTLISFIEIEPKKAIEFGHHLSNVYRHYLKSETEDFVFLSNELKFINDYLEIYKAKFENGFSFEIKNDPTQNLYILSFSLQEIIDNIFKHNILDEEKPIEIRISSEDNYLRITNSINPQSDVISTNKGLQNINNRNKILINKEITITKSNNLFEVKIPILKLEK